MRHTGRVTAMLVGLLSGAGGGVAIALLWCFVRIREYPSWASDWQYVYGMQFHIGAGMISAALGGAFGTFIAFRTGLRWLGIVAGLLIGSGSIAAILTGIFMVNPSGGISMLSGTFQSIPNMLFGTVVGVLAGCIQLEDSRVPRAAGAAD